jgi:hypothetical protein
LSEWLGGLGGQGFVVREFIVRGVTVSVCVYSALTNVCCGQAFGLRRRTGSTTCRIVVGVVVVQGLLDFEDARNIHLSGHYHILSCSFLCSEHTHENVTKQMQRSDTTVWGRGWERDAREHRRRQRRIPSTIIARFRVLTEIIYM